MAGDIGVRVSGSGVVSSSAFPKYRWSVSISPYVFASDDLGEGVCERGRGGSWVRRKSTGEHYKLTYNRRRRITRSLWTDRMATSLGLTSTYVHSSMRIEGVPGRSQLIAGPWEDKAWTLDSRGWIMSTINLSIPWRQSIIIVHELALLDVWHAICGCRRTVVLVKRIMNCRCSEVTRQCTNP
jgi:hypothetical protein